MSQSKILAFRQLAIQWKRRYRLSHSKKALPKSCWFQGVRQRKIWLMMQPLVNLWLAPVLRFGKWPQTIHTWSYKTQPLFWKLKNTAFLFGAGVWRGTKVCGDSLEVWIQDVMRRDGRSYLKCAKDRGLVSRRIKLESSKYLQLLQLK